MLAATQPDGSPITDLQADDILIQEDDSSISDPLTIENTLLENLHLVLALDVSMSNSDLSQLKRAAKSLLEDASPFDCLALVSFGDKVTPQAQCTNNFDSLQTTIDGLQTEPNLTKLHAAIVEASEIIKSEEGGRRAVILITDRHDNDNTVSLSDAISGAQEAGVPFYIIGFGKNVQQNHSIKTEIASTGGRYIVAADAGQVESELQNLIDDLQQGTRITFQSMLQADNKSHDLSLEIAYEKESAQATGQFAAVPNKVTVSLPANLSEIRVKGSLPLTPKISAPAPVASVTYMVDGEMLTTITKEPFSYTWDNRTQDPGQHTLTVHAVDEAGNEGEAKIPINLAKPLTIANITLPDEIPYGKAFTMEVTKIAGVDVENTTLAIDSQVITPTTSAANSDTLIFNVDSSAFSAGSHTITLQATDNLGQSDKKTATIIFALPAQRTWLDVISDLLKVSVATVRWGVNLTIDILIILLALICILILSLTALAIIRHIQHIHRQMARKRYILDIANTGNIDSHYELWADDPAKQLKFEFTLDGTRLPHRSKEEWIDDDTQQKTAVSNHILVSATPSSHPIAPVMEVAPAVHQTPQPPVQKQTPSPNTGKKGGLGKMVKGVLTPLAGALTTAARLLGPFGGPLRRVSSYISTGQSMAQRAAQKPKQIASQSKQLSKQLGQVTSSAGTPASKPATQPLPQTEVIATSQPTPAFATTVQPVPQQPPVAVSQPISPAKKPKKRSRQRYHSITHPAQTIKVSPGRSLSVELWIMPPSPYKIVSSPFTLYSQPVEQMEPLVNQEGVAEIRGLNWFQHWWPLTVVNLLTIVLITGIGYLAYWAVMNVNFLGLLSL
ncbi:MAG: VWA domain-containing protein [Anaerolineae bacterium]|nr:VWA domain-containing protein [Anaerolineae bacterium]